MASSYYVYLFKDGTSYTSIGKISASLKQCLIGQHGKLVNVSRI